MTYDHSQRRRQALAEAVSVQRKVTDRIVTLVGSQQGPSEREAWQSLADACAVLFGDTAAKQKARRDRLDKDAARYKVGRS